MITVVSVSTISWQQFVKGIQELTGKSPTRILDKYSLDLHNPFSALVVLQSLKTPLYNPWSDSFDDEILQHLSITIATDVSYTIAEDIYTLNSHLKITHVTLDRASCLLIMSGTLLDWKNVIPYMLKRNQTIEVRMVFSEVYTLFKNTDFRNLWSGYKIETEEGCLIMRLK